MAGDNFLEDSPAESKPSYTNKQPNHASSADGLAGSMVTGSAPEEPFAAGEARIDRLAGIWEGISRAGLAEATYRLGTHILLVALILIVAWGMREFYLRAQVPDLPREAALAASLPTAAPTEPPPEMPPYQPELAAFFGVSRLARLHTDVPSRPRTDVITYTVETGDSVFVIAEKFGLEPQTILWGNQFVLGDNPHNLRPGQELNILPVNGTYHRWSQGDGLNGVAKFFGVTPEEIINWPGNHLDPETIGDWSNPNIEPGAWLIIPGGEREFVSWSAPEIPRTNPGVAKVLGPGACGSVANGLVGSASFIWPANSHLVTGFDYNPDANHSGVDIDGNTGDPVYAPDHGVVVYAGWNNWGYGNVVVINHGNGWQTLHAHLSAYNVSCGASVAQGAVVGAVGSTGNSTGSHLHFEMMYNGTKVNPHDYLP